MSTLAQENAAIELNDLIFEFTPELGPVLDIPLGRLIEEIRFFFKASQAAANQHCWDCWQAFRSQLRVRWRAQDEDF